jgi:hypothetical protein
LNPLLTAGRPAICVASAVLLIDDFDSRLDELSSAPNESLSTTLSRIDAPQTAVRHFLPGFRE